MAPSVVGSQTEKARNNTSPLEQRVGQATSVVMPLLELGAVGFVTWVVCYLICVQYLISPAADLRQRFDVQPRRATGIALLVLYAILLLFILAPWLRVTQVIWSKPDLLPRGDAAREKKESDATPMEQYDAYICDHHGVPLYCDKCHIYKPDRAHHCKELGYCVRKMDHYCPWAGGIIAETSHKYFMQSVFFGAVYMAYSWVVTAIFLADRVQKTGSKPGTWIGGLVVGVLFSVFASTMACMTGYNLAINYTSVEAIQRGGVSNIAFRVSHTSQMPTAPPTPSNSSDPKESDADDDWPVLRVVQRSGGRTFVVMQTKAFQHPWATTLMQGWQDTMGNSPVEWFLPFKHSPCKQKGRGGEFRWGEVVYEMAAKYQQDHPGTQLALLEGRR